MLACCSAKPTTYALKTMLKLVGYVKCTRSRQFRLEIPSNWSEVEVVALSDAAFSTDESPRGGYILCLRPVGSDVLLPLSWRSSKQRCITMSTTESELVQLSITAREALSLIRHFTSWSSVPVTKLTIYGDNKAANLISEGTAALRRVQMPFHSPSRPVPYRTPHVRRGSRTQYHEALHPSICAYKILGRGQGLVHVSQDHPMDHP